MIELSPGTSPPPVRIADPVRGRVIVGSSCSSRLADPRSRFPSGPATRDGAACSIEPMNYELFMGEALAEARSRSAEARRRSPPSPSSTTRWSPATTIASRRPTTRPPTPWSSPCARRPAGSAATRLADVDRSSPPSSPARCASGRSSRATSRRWSTRSPTPGRRRRDRPPAGPAAALPRRLKVVSGIRRDEAEDLFDGDPRGRGPAPRRTIVRAGRPDALWYPLRAERCPSG